MKCDAEFLGLVRRKLIMLNPIQTDYTCQGCGYNFDNLTSLHSHIKEHKLNPEKYYTKYYPRKDLFTQQPLLFKSRDSYLTNDFITRTNLKKWLAAREEMDADLVKDYCRNWLLNRKFLKNLIYTPTSVELKTMIAPTVEYFNETFGDYYSLCAELGFKNKFGAIKDNLELLKTESKELKITVDSREQLALNLKDTKVEGLSFGDYAADEEITGKTRVERKSLSDLLGTLGKGYDRFQREIERAQAAGYNLVILVEESFSNYLSYPYMPHIRSKMPIECISHNIRELCQKYPNIQFLFVAGRKEAVRVVNRIFSIKDIAMKIDLQEALDKGLL